MDFEPGFTPIDAAIQFEFLANAYAYTETALTSWSNPSVDFAYGLVTEVTTEPADRAFLRKHYEEDKSIDIENMQQMHRASYFLMAFAFCESSVTKFASRFLADSDSPFKLKDLSGVGLERVKVVIAANRLQSNPIKNEVWTEILNFQKLRHAIVHSAGILEDQTSIDRIAAAARCWQGVELLDYGSPDHKSIELSDFFVKHAIGKLSNFTNSVAHAFFGMEDSTC